MTHPDRLVCGRSPLVRGGEAPAFLAERVRALLEGDRKLNNFAPKKTRQRGELDRPDMLFFGPLIPVSPPDGPSPYWFAQEADPGRFILWVNLIPEDEATFARLWTIGAGRQGAFSSTVLMGFDRFLGCRHALFDLNYFRSPPKKPQRRLAIQYTPDPDHPAAITTVVDFLGLRPFANTADLEPRQIRYPNESFMIVLGKLPDDPQVGIELVNKVRTLPGPAPGEHRSAKVTFGLLSPQYSQLRPAFNRVTRNWSCSTGAFRNPDFDLYSPPSDYGNEPLYRWPVAQTTKPWADIDRNLAIQVDVVHTPVGSYLEFLSTSGRKWLNHFAHLAGVELEFWDGSIFDRWGR